MTLTFERNPDVVKVNKHAKYLLGQGSLRSKDIVCTRTHTHTHTPDRRLYADHYSSGGYSQRTVMLAVSLCWPMSLMDVQRYCPASDGIRRSMLSSSLPGAVTDTVTWPFSWHPSMQCAIVTMN